MGKEGKINILFNSGIGLIPIMIKPQKKEVSKNEEQSTSTSTGKVFFCCTVCFTYIQSWFFMDFLRENGLDFKKFFYLTIYNSCFKLFNFLVSLRKSSS